MRLSSTSAGRQRRRLLRGARRWVGIALLAVAVFPFAARGQEAPPEVPGGEELKALIPDLKAACAMVRANPEVWPYRCFPYGPLGLEVRKASAEEGLKIRNFYLGVAAAACKIPLEKVTAPFECGQECARNRRDHLVKQLPQLRAAVAAFEKIEGLRLLSIWFPKEELRVNDVFVMEGKVREAVPSAKLGMVPSGSWKPWESLQAYLTTLKTTEDRVRNLAEQLRNIGLSALVREKSATRVVGVGVGDDESGLLFLRPGAPPPRVGDARRDGSRYSIVEKVGPDLWYYETS